jgi:hypothetical protein
MATDAGIGADVVRNARAAGQAWRRFWRRRSPGQRLVFFVTLALVLAALAIVFGWLTADSKSDEVSVELAKTGLGLAAVAILGGAIAAAFRSLDAERDHQRRIDEYRAATVSELWATYNQIKAVRRTLRAYGLDAPQGNSVLVAKQVAAFRAQMGLLNDAQLMLEKLKREVCGQTELFGSDGACIARLLGRAEDYVSGVIDDWEKHGSQIDEGTNVVVLNDFHHLCSFLGKAKPTVDSVTRSGTHPAADCETTRGDRSWSGIKAGLSIPIERAADLIGALRFRTTPPQPPAADASSEPAGGAR